ncbi:hypothetical protein HJG60_011269 [Phyllostomus discolor]|uniref:small monomeric GTPase n=1 Tax=Phyllostomus discolor TaxID=89673 RepID=A0A834E580_9CHIR|nr:hypothetical protein HJG60_011269 [Phyllostomus discolor]
MLGNKCDLNNKETSIQGTGRELALDYEIKFMETSVKANINVENTFFTLPRDIMDKKLEGSSPQGTTGESKSRQTSRGPASSGVFFLEERLLPLRLAQPSCPCLSSVSPTLTWALPLPPHSWWPLGPRSLEYI